MVRISIVVTYRYVKDMALDPLNLRRTRPKARTQRRRSLPIEAAIAPKDRPPNPRSLKPENRDLKIYKIQDRG